MVVRHRQAGFLVTVALSFYGVASAQEESDTAEKTLNEKAGALSKKAKEDAEKIVDEKTKTAQDPQAKKPEEKLEDEVKGILGFARVGPFFAVGFPHPLNAGLDAKFGKSWDANIGVGSFTYNKPDSSSVKNLKLNIMHYEAGGYWHPWAGSFYMGGNVGYQKIKVSADSARKISTAGASSEIDLSAEFTITSTYVTPIVGWSWVWNSGFNLGTHLGIQLPMTSSSNFESKISGVAGLEEAVKRLAEYQELESAVKDAGKKAGSLALPRWEILHIGWVF